MLSHDPLLIKFCFEEMERNNLFPLSSGMYCQRIFFECLLRHKDMTNTEGLWAIIECILTYKPTNLLLFEKIIAKIVYRMLSLL
jgi:hypothetical protein